MGDKKFDLGDYVEVKDRIRILYELYPQARLVTGEVTLTSEPDGVPRVMVQAFAYRAPDDPHPGVGYSWMTLPGSTTYTRGSELENVETSAWGRAIASLGILVDRSIASAQEVQNKQNDAVSAEPDRAVGQETLELLGRIQKSGKVMKGGSERYKGEYHETPDGHAIGFRLKLDGKDDRDIPQVLVNAAIGETLYVSKVDLLGEHLTVKGHLYNVKQAGRSAYYRLIVGERAEDFLETADLRIPPLRDPEQEAVDVPVAPGQEAFDLTAEALA